MNNQSETLRRDIALLQRSAETLKTEANNLIERSKELGKEIEKRVVLFVENRDTPSHDTRSKDAA
jgi:hypothetical protein